MNPALQAYRCLVRGIVSVLDVFPPKRLDIEEVSLRKGYCQLFPDEGLETIWVHGASLGEVITLRPLLKSLADRYGRNRILATSMTMDGLKRLRSDDLVDRVTLLPLEIPGYLSAFVDRMKPSLVLISETEIWPYFFAFLKFRNIPYGIVNARINPKTVKLLKVLRPLFQEALDGLSFVFPQDEVYLRRYEQAGISRKKLDVLGCFKFDLIDQQGNPNAYRSSLGLPPEEPVVCFGSTHPGEERALLEALRGLPEWKKATVILAPRHLNRMAEVELLLREFQVAYNKLSVRQRKPEKLILVDTHGDLRNLYSISSLAFVGGSLIPRGGHNLMEPAAFGVPVAVGPHTENFPLERSALEKADALIAVKNGAALRALLAGFLENPEGFKPYGIRARQVLQRMSGSVQRTLHKLDALGLLPQWPPASSSD